MKHEWRKSEKETYLPKAQPTTINLPTMKYFTIEGAANPRSKEFSEAVGALYAMSYGVKMSPKKGTTPEGYFDYTIYPLEGFWSLNQHGIKQFNESGTFNKSDLVFKIMIRQPDFTTEALSKEVIERVSKTKPNPYNKNVNFEIFQEGFCVQALHIGSYDTETETFAKMKLYCEENSLQRTTPYHKEVYLSDPRKTSPEKNKTVLRFSVSN